MGASGGQQQSDPTGGAGGLMAGLGAMKKQQEDMLKQDDEERRRDDASVNVLAPITQTAPPSYDPLSKLRSMGNSLANQPNAAFTDWSSAAITSGGPNANQIGRLRQLLGIDQ